MILTSTITDAIVDYFSTRRNLLLSYEQKGIFLKDIVNDVELISMNKMLIKLNNYGAKFFLIVSKEFSEKRDAKKGKQK